jgi:hypothetical protein
VLLALLALSVGESETCDYSSDGWTYECTTDSETAVALGITAAVLGAAGLSVGVPLIVQGQGRLSEARKRVGRSGLSAMKGSGGRAMLRLRWRF